MKRPSLALTLLLTLLATESHAQSIPQLGSLYGPLQRGVDGVRGIWMPQVIPNTQAGFQTRPDWWSLTGEVVNVKEFGATADGVTSDTPAINLAIAAASARSGALVIFPAGIYRLATSPTAPTSGKLVFQYLPGVTFTGAGSMPTIGARVSIFDVGTFTFNGIGIGLGASSVSSNTALGSGVLAVNTTGQSNTGVGFQVLPVNTIGLGNTGVGTTALTRNTSGNYNTGTGVDALFTNTTGYDNTATGADALGFNVDGNSNTATGAETLFANTAGNFNTASGRGAMRANLTGSYNVALGNDALATQTAVDNNVAVGWSALKLDSGGTGNTAIGTIALTANTTGSNNAAVGLSALSAHQTGLGNTGIGPYSLSANVSGAGNVGLGYFAGAYETGSNAFYVDNQDRTNTAGDKAGALLYGTFNATAASQTLKTNSKFHITITQTPATAAAACDTGQIAWDTGFIYVCVTTNTWKRVAIATW